MNDYAFKKPYTLLTDLEQGVAVQLGVAATYPDIVKFKSAAEIHLEQNQGLLGSDIIGGIGQHYDGTEASPGLVPVSDIDSGRYLVGSDNLGESIGGVRVFDWNGSRMRFNSIDLIWTTDNAEDIGASAANRPRNIYVGTNVDVGSRIIVGSAGTSPTATGHFVVPAAIPGLLIDAATTDHTDTSGVIDLNVDSASNNIFAMDSTLTVSGTLSNNVGIRSVIATSGSSGGTGEGVLAFQAVFSSSAGNGANFIGYGINTQVGYGGFGTSNGIILFKYSQTYTSSTTALSPEYGIFLKQDNSNVAVTDAFRAVYIERGLDATSGATVLSNPFIQLYQPLSSSGAGTATSSAQFLKMELSADSDSSTRISGKMVEEILDGTITNSSTLTGYHLLDGGVIHGTTTILRGIHVDFTASPVSSGTLEGLRVECPASYGAGTERSAIFTGDGRTAELCSDTYAGDFTGDTRVTGTLTAAQTATGSIVTTLTSTATNDDVTESTTQGRVATTDATVTTIFTQAIAASTTYMIESRVWARRTGGTSGTADDGWSYIHCSTWQTATGVVTQIGATTAIHTNESQAAFDVTHVASGTDVLVRVTGAANNNVTWHSSVTVRAVSS